MHNVMMAAEYFVDIYNSILKLDTGPPSPAIPNLSDFGQIFISKPNEELVVVTCFMTVAWPEQVNNLVY